MSETAETGHRIFWSGHTDRGRVRVENEDSFLCLRFQQEEVQYLGKVGETSTDSYDCIFAVSDGMGGALAGEFASKIAVEKITKLLPDTFRQSAAGLTPDFDGLLTKLYEEIHKALEFLGNSYEECEGMGTTLSLCWFRRDTMHFAHIGDSRIYHLPAASKELTQLTEDDSHVGWLFRQGKINEREARQHPRRTALSKALGAGHRYVEPQVGSVKMEEGDAFFLCTDGVVDGLSNNQISRLLLSPEPNEAKKVPADRVVNYSVEVSGKDNTTALFIELE